MNIYGVTRYTISAHPRPKNSNKKNEAATKRIEKVNYDRDKKYFKGGLV